MRIQIISHGSRCSQETSIASGRNASILRISNGGETPLRHSTRHFKASSTAGSTRRAGIGSSEEKQRLIATAEVEEDEET